MITADLTGKAALITGGGSGIGLAATEMFARCGATVAANVLPGDAEAAARIERLAGEGLAVFPAPADIAIPAEVERLVGAVVGRMGKLDYLLNNAGITNTREPIDFADLAAMTGEFWDRILAVNLVAPFNCARAAAPALKASRGAIVNTASLAGLGIRGSSIAYAASKAALINLTRSLAKALAPDVRVNAVAPALVETPITATWPAARIQGSVSRTLLARTSRPEEVAEAMLYLSAGASYMTGQTIVLDGGAV